MDIEKVNDNKIKVTLTFDDLFERDIDYELLHYDSPEAQDLFWDMMEQAELLYGFDTADSQLCVEAIPDSSKGFIVTITKVEEDAEFQAYPKYVKSSYKKSDFTSKNKKIPKYNTGKIISLFLSTNELKEFTTRISDIYTGMSSLYKHKEKYYLVLSRNTFKNVKDSTSLESIISEYGTRINMATLAEGILNEHGTKLMSDNAIKLINNLY